MSADAVYVALYSSLGFAQHTDSITSGTTESHVLHVFQRVETYTLTKHGMQLLFANVSVCAPFTRVRILLLL